MSDWYRPLALIFTALDSPEQRFGTIKKYGNVQRNKYYHPRNLNIQTDRNAIKCIKYQLLVCISALFCNNSSGAVQVIHLKSIQYGNWQWWNQIFQTWAYLWIIISWSFIIFQDIIVLACILILLHHACLTHHMKWIAILDTLF